MARYKLNYKVKFIDEENPEDNYSHQYKSNSESYKYYDIEYLLVEFKHFLLSIGYAESTVSRIQYLKDDEWKHVLTE